MVMRISWSQLRTHEECKQRGFLQRTGHKSVLDNQRVFFPGTVTDRVVRDWLQNDPEANLGAMPDMVESVMDREWKITQDEGGTISWKNASDRAQVLTDCREAVTKIEPALLKLVVPYEYQADFKFQAPVTIPHPKGGVEEVLLIGYMDILVKDHKGRYWVHDVKHTKDNSYWRKTEGQLTFYDLATEIMFGQPTFRTSLLQPLCTEQVKAVRIDPDKRSQMLQRVTSMAQDRMGNVVTPRDDTKFCGWCSVRHACSKFQPVVNAKGKRVIEF